MASSGFVSTRSMFVLGLASIVATSSGVDARSLLQAQQQLMQSSTGPNVVLAAVRVCAGDVENKCVTATCPALCRVLSADADTHAEQEEGCTDDHCNKAAWCSMQTAIPAASKLVSWESIKSSADIVVKLGGEDMMAKQSWAQFLACVADARRQTVSGSRGPTTWRSAMTPTWRNVVKTTGLQTPEDDQEADAAFVVVMKQAKTAQQAELAAHAQETLDLRIAADQATKKQILGARQQLRHVVVQARPRTVEVNQPSWVRAALNKVQ